LKFFQEFYRILIGTFGYTDLLILTQNESNFYNFFFAFIAVLFAQSVVITFWLNRPNYFQRKYNYKRNMTINDHRLTTWFFIHWFAEIGLMFGLVAVDTHHLDIYRDYRFLFYLTAIILFMQVWNSFRFVFKNRSNKWILLSFACVVILSFGISKINIINFKYIDHIVLQQNEHYKYNIHVPKSNIYHKYEHLNLVHDVYIAKNSSVNSEPLIIENERIIELSHIAHMIYNFQGRFIEQEIPYINHRLHVDNDIKMYHLSNIKNEFIKVGVKKISYAIIPSDKNPNIPFYQKNRLFFNRHHIINDLNKDDYEQENLIDLKYTNNQLYLNNTKIGFQKFKEKSKQLVKDSPNYILVVNIDKEMNFSNYFKILLTFTEGILELRNEYTLKKYSKEYKVLEKEVKFDRNLSSQMLEINEKHPIYIMDKVANN